VLDDCLPGIERTLVKLCCYRPPQAVAIVPRQDRQGPDIEGVRRGGDSETQTDNLFVRIQRQQYVAGADACQPAVVDIGKFLERDRRYAPVGGERVLTQFVETLDILLPA